MGLDSWIYYLNPTLRDSNSADGSCVDDFFCHLDVRGMCSHKAADLQGFWVSVVSSVKDVSDRALTHVRLALQLHEAFNFAQMLQGEMLGQSLAEEQ